MSGLTLERHRRAQASITRPSSFDIELCRAGGPPSGRPAGERMTVTPRSCSDTVGDLAIALGIDNDNGLTLDGTVVRRDALLTDVGCLHGSRLAIGQSLRSLSTPLASADSATAVMEMSIDSGPDCTATVALGAGRHVIGRSPDAHLSVADARLGLHHAVIDVDATSVTVTQLSGQAPIRVDGEPVTGTHTVFAPVRLTIGTSDVRLSTVGSVEQRPAEGNVVSAPHDPWRRIVQRSPDRPIAPAGDPITPPAAADLHRAPPATALIGAAVGVLGAGVIALLLGQMLFALFAAFGAVASAATWLVGAISAWRRNRRSRRLVDNDRQRFLDELAAARSTARRRHLLTHPDLGQSIATTAALTGPLPLRSDVWQQRLTDTGGRISSSADGFTATTFHPVIGMGTCRWTPILAGEIAADSAADLECAATIDDVPIPVALACGEVTAISGDPADRSAVLRSMLCQMAVRYGPADWQLVVVSSSAERWAWASWLPHAATTTGTVLLADASDPDDVARVLALAGGSTPRPTLLVVDDPALFAVRTGPLRRFVERVHPATVTTIDVGAPTPAVCTAVIEIGSTGAVMTTRLDGAGGDIADSASSIRMCGLSMERSAAIARALATLIDPEMLALSEARLVRNVALSDLDDVVLMAGGDDRGRRTAVSTVQRRWLSGGADPAPKVAIGQSADGLVEVDLAADGPHALVAGTTGSGKSEMLRSLVVGLSLRLSPEHLTFVLVDYKGGSTFDRCAELPHTVGMVTDLDAGLAERALVSLDAELHRRERMLRAVGAVDLADYRLHPGALVLPRLVVVIDEFAALAKELPEFLAALVGIAQRGRSLGVHLILATQRPAGVVSDDIRANTNLRIALRLNDGADALDVVCDVRPSAFARDVPGRAALRLGPEELVVFQTARCSGAGRQRADAMCVAPTSPQGDRLSVEPTDTDASTELDVAASVIAAAFQQLSIEAPHRPWLDALPERLSSAAVDLQANSAAHDGVGVLDDPAAQRRQILRSICASGAAISCDRGNEGHRTRPSLLR